MAVESVLNLDELRLRPVERSEEPVYRQLMAAHHYVGLVPKIGHTLWYEAVLFSVSDLPVMEALKLYREEAGEGA